ncbi:unnamed protein product [Closterium sp. Yama58-4]|nr:unnamed protein product [Closterium sp. Yama58-4]
MSAPDLLEHTPEETSDLPFPREGHSVAFVYGTLKEGFSNHWLMQELMQSGDAIRIGTARTVQNYPLVCGPFQVPFLLRLPGNGHRVFGEIYEVNEKAVARLDILEGTDRGHYVRLPLFLSDVEVRDDYEMDGKYRHLREGINEEVKFTAVAYFAGMDHTPGLAMGEAIESFDARAAATYVPRRERPPNKTFLEHVHAWIQERRSLVEATEEAYRWALPVQ